MQAPGIFNLNQIIRYTIIRFEFETQIFARPNKYIIYFTSVPQKALVCQLLTAFALLRLTTPILYTNLYNFKCDYLHSVFCVPAQQFAVSNIVVSLLMFFFFSLHLK